MKKGLTIILSMALVFTMAITPVAASETSDTKIAAQAVQTLLQKAKTLFNIDETGKKFSYDTNTDEESGMFVYKFRWTNETNDSMENVSINKDGFVLSYYNKDNSDTSESNIPKISKKEALDSAYDKAIAIFPDAKNEISKDMATVINSYNGDNSYSITFDREIDGVKVYGNSLSLTIDNMTGALLQYNVDNWVLHIQKPAKTTLLAKDEIQKSFTKNMPLELMYTSSHNQKTEKDYTHLVYGSSLKDEDSYMDARTGEKIKIKQQPQRFYSDDCIASAEAVDPEYDSFDSQSLSEEEVAETETHSNFITQQKAVSILSSISNLSFDQTLPIESLGTFSQKSSYTDATSYTFDLSWGNDNAHADAKLDAQTGELLSYRTYTSYDEDHAKNSKSIGYDSAKQKAESFLTSQKSTKYKMCEYAEPNSDNKNVGSFTFTYYRMVNGIPFYDEGMQLTVNGTTGKITSYDESWSDATFDSAKDALSAEKALDNYMKFFNPNYYYVPVTEDENKELTMSGQKNAYTASFQMIPVYKYEFAYIDAKKGDVLGYDLKPYDKVNTYINLDSLYPQLNGHYAKDIILKLFDMGIKAENKNFDPDALIPKSEFKNLAQSLNGSYHPYYDTISSKSDIEESSQPLTRMEAIKIIIDTLGYGKVASQADMFKCTFDDVADIASWDLGFATMAKGLGISVGTDNKLMPDKQITYAEAFIMIYRALNV